jgi:cytoskeleton protein RodZ
MTKVTRFTMSGNGQGSGRLHLREISGDADAPLGTVGQDLRAARLRRGDELALVARDLKIRKDHLEALEEDRVEALPGRTYAVGFVRTYALYLGLDASEYVERFKTEIAGRAENPHLTPFIEPVERRLPQGWIVIAAVLAALLIYGVYKMVSSAVAPGAPPVAPVPAQLAPKPAQPAVTKPASPPPVSQAATAPESGARVAGENAAAAAATPSTTAPQTVETLPKGEVFGLQNTNPRVVLLAHRATLVNVVGPDGTVYINRVLEPGDSYRVPNVPGLKLKVAEGDAVELLLDGAASGYASTGTGAVEGVSLDPQAVADLKNTKAPH